MTVKELIEELEGRQQPHATVRFKMEVYEPDGTYTEDVEISGVHSTHPKVVWLEGE